MLIVEAFDSEPQCWTDLLSLNPSLAERGIIGDKRLRSHLKPCFSVCSVSDGSSASCSALLLFVVHMTVGRKHVQHAEDT